MDTAAIHGLGELNHTRVSSSFQPTMHTSRLPVRVAFTITTPQPSAHQQLSLPCAVINWRRDIQWVTVGLQNLSFVYSGHDATFRVTSKCPSAPQCSFWVPHRSYIRTIFPPHRSYDIRPVRFAGTCGDCSGCLEDVSATRSLYCS